MFTNNEMWFLQARPLYEHLARLTRLTPHAARMARGPSTVPSSASDSKNLKGSKHDQGQYVHGRSLDTDKQAVLSSMEERISRTALSPGILRAIDNVRQAQGKVRRI